MKKHPRLANGMGSIKYLGKGRSNPYAVYAPEYRVSDNGHLSYSRPICYVPDWYTGFAVLVSYKAGTYKQGDEVDIARRMKSVPESELSYVSRKILADYRSIGKREEAILIDGKHTFYSVWEEYYEDRFGKYSKARFSEKTRLSYAGFIKVWEELYEKYIEDIRVEQIQNIVNKMSEENSKKSIAAYLAVLSAVMSFARTRGYIEKSPSQGIKIPMIAKDTVHAEPYSHDDLIKLWESAEGGNETAISILIQVYSGFRISAFKDMVVDLDNQTFYGGVKSRTGQKRTVPIHSSVFPMVKDQMEQGSFMALSNHASSFNRKIESLCRQLGIEGSKTTHSARHTFKMLCDRYGVNTNAAKILMGHSLASNDIHDSVYTHFELSDLRREIEKIQRP